MHRLACRPLAVLLRVRAIGEMLVTAGFGPPECSGLCAGRVNAGRQWATLPARSGPPPRTGFPALRGQRPPPSPSRAGAPHGSDHLLQFDEWHRQDPACVGGVLVAGGARTSSASPSPGRNPGLGRGARDCDPAAAGTGPCRSGSRRERGRVRTCTGAGAPGQRGPRGQANGGRLHGHSQRLHAAPALAGTGYPAATANIHRVRKGMQRHRRCCWARQVCDVMWQRPARPGTTGRRSRALSRSSRSINGIDVRRHIRRLGKAGWGRGSGNGNEEPGSGQDEGLGPLPATQVAP